MNPSLKGLDQWPNVATKPAIEINPDWVTADMELGGQPTPFSRFWMEQGHASPVPEIVKRAYQAGFDEGLKTNATP